MLTLTRTVRAPAGASGQAEVELTLKTLSRPGDVFEIRALMPPKIVVGFFQHEKIDTVCDLMKKSVIGASGVYVTSNQLDTALLARAPNCFKACWGKDL